MSVLRIYDPNECDEHGVPLDWERCRKCSDGRIVTPEYERGGDIQWRTCDRCDGHGSLKAAALLAFWGVGYQPSVVGEDGKPRFRCEDCGHPMSEGTWEPVESWPTEGGEVDLLRAVGDVGQARGRHYSPCDEGCRHGGPGRIIATAEWNKGRVENVAKLNVYEGYDKQASWRPVDVRTLGWAHDLRPEKLAVLCLRCWAARGKPTVPNVPVPATPDNPRRCPGCGGSGVRCCEFGADR